MLDAKEKSEIITDGYPLSEIITDGYPREEFSLRKDNSLSYKTTSEYNFWYPSCQMNFDLRKSRFILLAVQQKRLTTYLVRGSYSNYEGRIVFHDVDKLWYQFINDADKLIYTYTICNRSSSSVVKTKTINFVNELIIGLQPVNLSYMKRWREGGGGAG